MHEMETRGHKLPFLMGQTKVLLIFNSLHETRLGTSSVHRMKTKSHFTRFFIWLASTKQAIKCAIRRLDFQKPYEEKPFFLSSLERNSKFFLRLDQSKTSIVLC